MPKAQREVIERLVQPIGVTVISNGVSITLDSVTPGESSIWMLLKIEGTGQKEQHLWSFTEKNLTGGPMEKKLPTMIDSRETYPDGASLLTAGLTEDGAQMELLVYDAPKGVNFLEGGDLTLTLGKMWARGSGDEEATEIKGRWALAFTLEPVEELEVLTARDAKVPAQEIQWVDGQDEPNRIDKTVTLKNIRVTSLGISYEIAKEASAYEMKAPALRLKGGMKIEMLGGSGSEGERQYSWSLPVNLSKAEAVWFGDVVIPMEKPKK